MENATRSGSQAPVLPKRREVRMPVTLNVRLLGIDANGKAFHQATVTADISLSGARVTGLVAKLNPGDIVGLQSGGEKCRFKVSWTTTNRDGTYQVGLHCLEKGTSPWRETMQKPKGGRAPQRRALSLQRLGLGAISGTEHADLGRAARYQRRGLLCAMRNPADLGDIVSGQFVVNGVQINGVAEVTQLEASGRAWDCNGAIWAGTDRKN